MPDNYYYLNEQNKAVGPFSKEDLNRQQENGLISQDTLVCEEGGDDWIPVSELQSKMSVTTEEPQVFYYLNESNTAVGPFSLDELTRQCDARVIEPTTLVCKGGSDTWEPLAEFIPAGQLAVKGDQVNREEADKSIPSTMPTGEKPKKFVSASLWQKVKVATIAGTVGWILIWSSIGLSPVLSENGAIAFYFLGWASFLAMSVLHAVVYIRCWNNLAARHRLMGPRMAVYPLFIPLWHLYWIFVCLRRLVMSLAAWEDEAGINPQPVLLNRATILACLISADLFFLILGVPTVVAFPVYCGAMVATNCLGYVVFKHLVSRINQLRGTPEDTLMEKTDEDGSGKVLPFGRLNWAAISLGVMSGVVWGIFDTYRQSQFFITRGAGGSVMQTVESIRNANLKDNYVQYAPELYDAGIKRYEAQADLDKFDDLEEYQHARKIFASAGLGDGAFGSEVDARTKGREEAIKALQEANKAYEAALKQLLTKSGGKHWNRSQGTKAKQWDRQVAAAAVEKHLAEASAASAHNQEQAEAFYRLRSYEQDLLTRLKELEPKVGGGIDTNAPDPAVRERLRVEIHMELERCRNQQRQLIRQIAAERGM